MAESRDVPHEASAPTGIWAVLATPFDHDGEVDYGALCAEVEWVAALGVRGVIANGVTSEAHKLSHDERCRAAEAVRAALPKELGLEVGISEPSCPLIQVAAKRAGALEPDAVMVWPAGSELSGNVRLVEEMQSLAAEASGAPVVMQDAAFFGPPPLHPCSIAELVNRSAYVCAVKVEAPRSVERMLTIQELAERPVRLIGGQGGRFLPLEYEVGARAFFIGPGFPELYVSTFRQIEDGCGLPDGWRRLVPLLDFMFQSAEFATACYKRLLCARGVLSNAKPRAPSATLRPAEEKHLLRLGQELGLL